MKEMEKYDDNIVDVDEVKGTDIKLNPDYYFHTAILKAQEALADEDIKRGMIRYRLMIEHLQGLAISSGRLTESYHTKLDEFKKTKEYLDALETAQNVKLAHKRFELILLDIFSRTVSTEKGKL